jgi:hypothetical protein
VAGRGAGVAGDRIWRTGTLTFADDPEIVDLGWGVFAGDAGIGMDAKSENADRPTR